MLASNTSLGTLIETDTIVQRNGESIPRSTGTGMEPVPVLIKLKVIRTRSRTRTNFFCPFCPVYVTSSPELKSTRTPSIFPYPQGKGTRTRSRTRTENVGISYVPVSVPIPVLFQYTFRTSKTRKISESKDTVTRAPPSPVSCKTRRYLRMR